VNASAESSGLFNDGNNERRIVTRSDVPVRSKVGIGSDDYILPPASRAILRRTFTASEMMAAARIQLVCDSKRLKNCHCIS